MIPLMVCKTGGVNAWIVAIAGCLLAIASGAVIGRWKRLVGLIRPVVVAAIVGSILPTLLLLGWFPFDSDWLNDCGYTPDPNIEVIYATMAFPMLTILSCWLVGKKRIQP